MLSEAEQIALKKYTRRVQMPTMKYLMVYGLRYSGIMFVFVSVSGLIRGISLQEYFKNEFWANLITLPIMAIFIGYIHRWYSIKSFQYLKAKEQTAD